jgi:hypothetical protein
VPGPVLSSENALGEALQIHLALLGRMRCRTALVCQSHFAIICNSFVCKYLPITGRESYICRTD